MEENDSLPHDKFLEKFKTSLADIISSDTLLTDLPVCVTSDELECLAGVEEGRMISITINDICTIVSRQATVSELKRAFKHQFTLHLQRNKSSKHINWRYIWKTYYLCYDGEKLRDDNKPLKEYGITEKCRVYFLPRLKERFYSRKGGFSK